MERHTYFAYGSNLCQERMSERCPGATDPRPAVLDDHDWLINERGVATLDPFIGSTVHGVLWTLTDRDLTNLDRAEGVPECYRRARLTVRTAHGPAKPWVYIDHRAQPGIPRDGYLERIINGALHHDLPRQWIEYLRRWDPKHWPMSRSPANDAGPQTLSELLADPAVVEVSTLQSRFGFMAIHGGGLEQMTDVIAERAAEQCGASMYLLRHPRDYPHHLPSVRYIPEQSTKLAEFLDHVDVVVSLHGYGRLDRSTHILAGGGNRELAMLLAQCGAGPG